MLDSAVAGSIVYFCDVALLAGSLFVGAKHIDSKDSSAFFAFYEHSENLPCSAYSEIVGPLDVSLS